MAKTRTTVGVLASEVNSPLSQNFSLNSKKTKRKGFSVAEAMIALLIGSLALGMAAPMITKQIKQTNFNDTEARLLRQQINNIIPQGFLFFTTNTCPTQGWRDVTSQYEGAFIKISSNSVGEISPATGGVPEHYHIVGRFVTNNDFDFIYLGNHREGESTTYGYRSRHVVGEGSGSSQRDREANYFSNNLIKTGSELYFENQSNETNTDDLENSNDFEPRNVSLRVCQKI